MKDNIILIGPPGVGKSTVGVLLAKALSKPFVDTDIIIQAVAGRRLQDILDTQGVDAFRRIEEECILNLNLSNYVIATGGSVVYSPKAMAHLKASGKVVFLSLECEDLLDRIEAGLDSRGVVLPSSQSFDQMYAERLPLYRKCANVEVDCTGLNHEQVLVRIADALGREI